MNLSGAKKVTQADHFTKKPVTNRQKFEKLKSKNPNLNLLIKKFDLESSFEL